MSMTPGHFVLLLGVPERLLVGLPEEDELAIVSAIGNYVWFQAIDNRGRYELEFTCYGAIHTIWLDPGYANLLKGVE